MGFPLFSSLASAALGILVFCMQLSHLCQGGSQTRSEKQLPLGLPEGLRGSLLFSGATAGRAGPGVGAVREASAAQHQRPAPNLQLPLGCGQNQSNACWAQLPCPGVLCHGTAQALTLPAFLPGGSPAVAESSPDPADVSACPPRAGRVYSLQRPVSLGLMGPEVGTVPWGDRPPSRHSAHLSPRLELLPPMESGPVSCS